MSEWQGITEAAVESMSDETRRNVLLAVAIMQFGDVGVVRTSMGPPITQVRVEGNGDGVSVMTARPLRGPFDLAIAEGRS